jgi:hypothetical protein
VGKVVKVQVGEYELLVEASEVTGTEPTSALDKVGDKVSDAMERAKDAIVAIGQSTVDVIERLAKSPAAHPNKVEVEFGLGVTAKGNVVVAEASAEATLKVKLVYEVKK